MENMAIWGVQRSQPAAGQGQASGVDRRPKSVWDVQRFPSWEYENVLDPSEQRSAQGKAATSWPSFPVEPSRLQYEDGSSWNRLVRPKAPLHNSKDLQRCHLRSRTARAGWLTQEMVTYNETLMEIQAGSWANCWARRDGWVSGRMDRKGDLTCRVAVGEGGASTLDKKRALLSTRIRISRAETVWYRQDPYLACSCALSGRSPYGGHSTF